MPHAKRQRSSGDGILTVVATITNRGNPRKLDALCKSAHPSLAQSAYYAFEKVSQPGLPQFRNVLRVLTQC